MSLVARHKPGAEGTTEVYVDASSAALQTIDYSHREIHAGDAYSVCFENQVAAENAQTVIAFQTPNTTNWIHLQAICAFTSIARCELLELATIDNDKGTQKTVVNRNRNSANTSNVLSIETVPKTGVVTTFNEAQAAGANIAGTTLCSTVEGVPAGPGAKTLGSGGTTAERAEWVLRQGAKYAVRITALDDTASFHTIELLWYEHTNIRNYT